MELLRDPDAELVAACRNPNDEGFEEAFEVLFARYRERVYAIAFRIAGNQADALDIVQESFALLFRKLWSFRGNSLFSTWLFRMVVNCSIDHRRRQKGKRAPHCCRIKRTRMRWSTRLPGHGRARLCTRWATRCKRRSRN